MRDTEVSNPPERVTPEEIDALRRLQADADGRMPDVRDHGAVTVGDVAEALGVPPDEVRRQLDGVREARAFRPAARPRDQRGLLALAVVLLGSAFAIHRLNPRPLSPDEIEAQLDGQMAELQARRRLHPIVHYPIEKRVENGPYPPSGFDVELRGALTTTRLPSRGGLPAGREEVQAALARAFAHAYEEARTAEVGAPPPTKPLPKPLNPSWGYQTEPGALALFVRQNPCAYLSMDPASATIPVTRLPSYPRPYGTVRFSPPSVETFDWLAKNAVESAMAGQKRSLEDVPDMPRNAPEPPAGFSVTMKGRIDRGAGSTPLFVLPIDRQAVARRLEKTIRALLRQDAEETVYPNPRLAPTKAATVAFVDVTILGPLGAVPIHLPQTASRDYPTAADALRASDRLLAEGIQRAADQITRLQGESRP